MPAEGGARRRLCYDELIQSCLLARRRALWHRDATSRRTVATARSRSSERLAGRSHEDRHPLRRRVGARASRRTCSSSGRSRRSSASLARRGEPGRARARPSSTDVDRARAPRQVRPRLQHLRRHRRRRELEPPVISVARAVRHPVHRELELHDVALPAQARRERAARARRPADSALRDSCAAASRLPSVGFPAICKPAAEDASLGVEQRSVVRTTRALAERVDAMLERWDEVLVQRYVDGREVNVGILGDTVLPDRRRSTSARCRAACGASSRISRSGRRAATRTSAPRRVARRDLPAEARRPKFGASRSARGSSVGGIGYGRVDMRIDARGQPWILEVNANPDIAPDAGLARMARVAGIEYSALMRTICELGARPRSRRAVRPRTSGRSRSGSPASPARRRSATGVRSLRRSR